MTLQRAFFYQDLSLQNYPCRHFFAEEWKQGRYPLWCPDILGGFPLFAEGQAGAAYPINLLLYPLLETWVALNFSVFLHAALAAAGMYLLMRLWTGMWGAALGAMVFALNGWMLSHVIHINAFSAAAWIPFAFYGFEQAWRRGHFKFIALSSAALAMQFLAGHAQVALYTWLGVLLFAMVRALGEYSKKHKEQAKNALKAGVAAVVFSYLLASIQTVPTQELVWNSSRAESQTYQFLTYGSFPPSMVALFVTPKLFGSQANDTQWLNSKINMPLHEMNFYIGLLPLFLVIFAIARRRDGPTLFFTLLAAFAGLFMLGKFTPFYRIVQVLPVFSQIRMPSRCAYLLVFALAALAALGLEKLGEEKEKTGLQDGHDEEEEETATEENSDGRGQGENEEEHSRSKDLITPPLRFFFIASLLLPLAVCIWSYGGLLPAALTAQAGRLRGEIINDAIRTFSFLLLSTWLLKSFPKATGQRRARHLTTMLVIAALDLWSANRKLNPTIEPSFYKDPPATAKALLKMEKNGGMEDEEERSTSKGEHPASRPSPIANQFRLYDFDRSSDPSPPGWLHQWPYFDEREPLNGCMPVSWGLRSLDGHLGLYLKRWWAYDNNISANRLGAMAVRYVVGKPPRDEEHFREVPASTPLPIYENLKAAPRAFLARSALKFSDATAFFRMLESSEWGPRATVLLEEPDAPDLRQNENPGTVRFHTDEPDRIVLEVKANAPAWLVLADSYYRGWEASVNGKPETIYRANFYARAVPVPEGKYQVEFRYRPNSFRNGVILTLIGLLACLCGCVKLKDGFRINGWSEVLSEEDVQRCLKWLAIAAAAALALSVIVEFWTWVHYGFPRF